MCNIAIWKCGVQIRYTLINNKTVSAGTLNHRTLTIHQPTGDHLIPRVHTVLFGVLIYEKIYTNNISLIICPHNIHVYVNMKPTIPKINKIYPHMVFTKWFLMKLGLDVVDYCGNKYFNSFFYSFIFIKNHTINN